MKPVASLYKRTIYFLSSFYSISRSEAIGFTVLIPLIILLIATPFWYKHVRSVEETDDPSAHETFIQWREELLAGMAATASPSPNIKPEINLVRFDPNTASSRKLQQLGFPPWVAERVVKYRNAGGIFSVKSDLSKIYGISDELVESVWDYIELPEKVNPPEPKKDGSLPSKLTERDKLTEKESVAATEKIVKNLNLATPEDFKEIQGIGEVLSTRIVKYRDLLGGFTSTEQLGEVYGLLPEVLESLKENFILEQVATQQLNINEATSKELASHPYIDKKLANAIVQYRVQHGDFEQLDDLTRIKILQDSVYQKILPYIKIN